MSVSLHPPNCHAYVVQVLAIVNVQPKHTKLIIVKLAVLKIETFWLGGRLQLVRVRESLQLRASGASDTVKMELVSASTAISYHNSDHYRLSVTCHLSCTTMVNPKRRDFDLSFCWHSLRVRTGGV